MALLNKVHREGRVQFLIFSGKFSNILKFFAFLMINAWPWTLDNNPDPDLRRQKVTYLDGSATLAFTSFYKSHFLSELIALGAIYDLARYQPSIKLFFVTGFPFCVLLFDVKVQGMYVPISSPGEALTLRIPRNKTWAESSLDYF